MRIDNKNLSTFANAHAHGCDNRQSFPGFIIIFNSIPISLKSNKNMCSTFHNGSRVYNYLRDCQRAFVALEHSGRMFKHLKI